MFYHVWCRTNAALMRTSINNPLFSSNCKTWLIDVHHTWSEENMLEVLHLVPLDLQFRHMQQHVRWHVNIIHTHIHQRPFHIMNASIYLSKLCHDGCDGKESVRWPNMHYSVWWKCKLGVECPFYKGFFAEDLVVLFQVFLLSCCHALLSGLCF